MARRHTPLPDRPGATGIDEVLLAAGALPLLWMTAVAAVAAAAFATGHALPRWTAPGAAALALGTAAALARPSRVRGRSLALAAALVAVGTAAALVASGAILDVSDDGQTYHLDAIVRLARGWNPWREALGPADTPNALWLDHYPRASWCAGAALYLATGRVETAKAQDLVLLGASFALAWRAARALLPARPRIAAGLAALAAMNPVAVVQVFTNYVDGLLASVLTSLLALVVAGPGRRGAPLRWVALACAAAIAVGLKFTGPVYAALLGAAGVAFAWRAASPAVARAAAAAVALGLAGGGLLQYDPYVRNLAAHGHPLWPVVGPGAVDIMSDELAPAFARAGRVTRLAWSLLASADRPPSAPPGPRLKVPFRTSRAELAAFREVDARASGFGPFFGGALLLAAGCLAATALRSPRAAAAGGALAAAILGSALANPHAWWARYAPQVWLVPLVVLVACLAARPDASGPPAAAPRRTVPGLLRPAAASPAAVLAALLALALAADAALVMAVSVPARWQASRAHEAVLETLRTRAEALPVLFGRSQSHRVRFDEHGVRYREGPLPCTEPRQLLPLTDTRYCP